MSLGLKVRNLRVFSDSLLLVNHVNNEYVARDSKMVAYLKIATEQKSKFRSFKITQVPRDQNVEADALAMLGATFQPTELSNIPITHVLTSAIQKEPDQDPVKEAVHVQYAQEVMTLVSSQGQQDPCWRMPYINWLKDGTLPEDRKEAQSFRIKASRTMPQVLEQKGGRDGAAWHAVNHAKRCESCQKAVPAIHQPAKPMHPIVSPWPFMMWGMDIVGKLLRAPGKRVYMLVMTDYFSKWIEVEAMIEVKEWQVISFIKRNIISRFGIPSEIICDNGSQFISDNTEGFCARWNITQRKSAPRYPQTNGQAESNNKIIVENLRKRLEELGGKWADELPLVIWSYRTTPKVATGQTPFSLVYGVEAVIPSEVLVPTHRYGCQTAEQNQVEMTRILDTIDELRESAYIRMASYKQTVSKTYNKNVKIKTLAVGDLVLRKVFKNTKNHKAGKFAYKWEGTYQVESIVKNGVYRFMTMHGQILDKPWNIRHLTRAKGARTEFQTSGTTRNVTFLISQKQSNKVCSSQLILVKRYFTSWVKYVIRNLSPGTEAVHLEPGQPLGNTYVESQLQKSMANNASITKGGPKTWAHNYFNLRHLLPVAGTIRV
ncbi:uncharacterized protein LOC141631560 [Silene latifolia]|uniref:uncharacterized protein LOC141631560 n=1 Tax=Silene latifolia TaxID=37657 RepID=UPI003D77B39D